MADAKQDYQTIIGQDARFKGELSFETSANILGNIEGSINSKGRVNVADGSECKATITANEISVEGHVEGNVEAKDRVEIKANGRITGDVVAAKMNMNEGASINGYCRIGVNGQAGANKSGAATEVKPESGSASGKASSSSSQQDQRQTASAGSGKK